MAMIVLLGAKGAPGATTTVAALASAWPTSLVVADCDPAGGDLTTGWLGQWLLAGRIRGDRGVLSYATATRHATSVNPDAVTEHLQTVPTSPHVRLLAGLQTGAQARSVGDAGWQRLALALATARTPQGRPVDVLVDAGRFSDAVAWPLLNAADLVLVAVRPRNRHLLAARPALGVLAQRIPSARLGLAVCATTTTASRDVARLLGHAVAVEFPDDPQAAAAFGDGENAGTPPARSPLARTASVVAGRLHTRLQQPVAPPTPPPSFQRRSQLGAPLAIRGAAR